MLSRPIISNRELATLNQCMKDFPQDDPDRFINFMTVKEFNGLMERLRRAESVVNVLRGQQNDLQATLEARASAKATGN